MPTKLTNETFLARANLKHNNLYSYELVDYQGAHTKIKIICKQHGEFLQSPTNHLNGAGCKVCANESLSATAKSEFNNKASIVHKSKYDYSLVDYKNATTKVKIVCPQHGSFEQRPNDHLSGKGCLLCAKENTGWTRTSFKEKCEKNNNGLGILYILECFNDNERFIKIGITSRSIKRRYHSITQMPYAYRVLDEIIGDPTYVYDLETKLHQINKQHQYVPSIPFCGSSTECFKEYKIQ